MTIMSAKNQTYQQQLLLQTLAVPSLPAQPLHTHLKLHNGKSADCQPVLVWPNCSNEQTGRGILKGRAGQAHLLVPGHDQRRLTTTAEERQPFQAILAFSTQSYYIFRHDTMSVCLPVSLSLFLLQ